MTNIPRKKSEQFLEVIMHGVPLKDTSSNNSADGSTSRGNYNDRGTKGAEMGRSTDATLKEKNNNNNDNNNNNANNSKMNDKNDGNNNEDRSEGLTKSDKIKIVIVGLIVIGLICLGLFLDIPTSWWSDMITWFDNNAGFGLLIIMPLYILSIIFIIPIKTILAIATGYIYGFAAGYFIIYVSVNIGCSIAFFIGRKGISNTLQRFFYTLVAKYKQCRNSLPQRSNSTNNNNTNSDNNNNNNNNSNTNSNNNTINTNNNTKNKNKNKNKNTLKNEMQSNENYHKNCDSQEVTNNTRYKPSIVEATATPTLTSISPNNTQENMLGPNRIEHNENDNKDNNNNNNNVSNNNNNHTNNNNNDTNDNNERKQRETEAIDRYLKELDWLILEKPFWTTLIVRLLPFPTMEWANYLLASTKVEFKYYFCATLVARFVSTSQIYVFLGSTTKDFEEIINGNVEISNYLSIGLAVGFAFIAIVIAFVMKKKATQWVLNANIMNNDNDNNNNENNHNVDMNDINNNHNNNNNNNIFQTGQSTENN